MLFSSDDEVAEEGSAARAAAVRIEERSQEIRQEHLSVWEPRSTSRRLSYRLLAVSVSFSVPFLSFCEPSGLVTKTAVVRRAGSSFVQQNTVWKM